MDIFGKETSADLVKSLVQESSQSNHRWLPFTKPIRLEISGINILKHLKATLRERESLQSLSTSARKTKKSRKIASAQYMQITAHIF